MPRKNGRQKEHLHRKKIFCPYCKVTVNHIECKDDEDVAEFKLAFENGEYKEEAMESIAMNEPVTGLVK